MSNNLLKVLVIVFTLMSFSSCQEKNNTTTSNFLAFEDGNFAVNRVKKEYEKLLTIFKWNELLKAGTVWKYTDKGTPVIGYDGYVEMTNFTISALSFNLSLTNGSIRDDSKDVFIQGTNQIVITYDFNYTSRTGTFSKPSGFGHYSVK
jgi:hypothetical protein